MGEVYRARDLRLGREIALKVLPATLAANAERLARFEREARAVGGSAIVLQALRSFPRRQAHRHRSLERSRYGGDLGCRSPTPGAEPHAHLPDGRAQLSV